MNGYLYILKHGIGPGTMPSDVTILKEKDLPNYYTAVWLDRFLTTSELKQYDIPSETEINNYLSRIDYCQSDDGNDVVPCDEVNACGNITASKIVASKMSDIDLLMKEALECTTKDELSAVVSSLDSLGFRKLYLHYMEMLRDDSLSVGYIASDLSDTLYNMFSDVEACGTINASTRIYANSDCYFDTQTKDTYTYDELKEYWYSFRNWDYVLADFTSFEDWFNTSIENGIFVPCDDVEACGDINCTTKPKYFANMVNGSSDPELNDDFLVEGYYDGQFRGLAESEETSDISALNELINDYANKGYFIRVRNLTDGVIYDFSADNWFNSIAPDGGAELFMSW